MNMSIVQRRFLETENGRLELLRMAAKARPDDPVSYAKELVEFINSTGTDYVIIDGPAW